MTFPELSSFAPDLREESRTAGVDADRPGNELFPVVIFKRHSGGTQSRTIQFGAAVTKQPIITERTRENTVAAPHKGRARQRRERERRILFDFYRSTMSEKLCRSYTEAREDRPADVTRTLFSEKAFTGGRRRRRRARSIAAAYSQHPDEPPTAVVASRSARSRDRDDHSVDLARRAAPRRSIRGAIMRSRDPRGRVPKVVEARALLSERQPATNCGSSAATLVVPPPTASPSKGSLALCTRLARTDYAFAGDVSLFLSLPRFRRP